MGQRALLYLRQSDSDGEGERSLSLDSQATVLRMDSERNRWVIIEEIRDADEKGWDDQRPGLLRLFERCRAGDVDVVAVWSLSRLARSLKIQEQVFDELGKLGVDVWSHEEPDVNRPLFRQILGAFNEEQTRVISAHVRRALQERHQRGLVHGHVLYGYRHEDNRLLIDESHAKVVRRIFEMRANGASWGDIGHALAVDGIDTPRGMGDWRKQTLIAIVRNTTYRGERQFGGSGKLRPCAAIVSPELWERAQRKDDVRPRAVRSMKKDQSWLEGLAVHGCGLPMYLAPRSTRQNRVRCASSSSLTARYRPCGVTPQSVIATHMEDEAWRIITEDLRAARAVPLRAIVAEARRRYRAARPGSDIAVTVATQQRNKALERRARAEDLYLGGLRDRAWFDAEDIKVAAEIAASDSVLRKLPAPPDAVAIEAVWSELRQLALQIGHVTEPAARAIVLRQLGRVRLDANGVSIEYRPHIKEVLGVRDTYDHITSDTLMEPARLRMVK